MAPGCRQHWDAARLAALAAHAAWTAEHDRAGREGVDDSHDTARRCAEFRRPNGRVRTVTLATGRVDEPTMMAATGRLSRATVVVGDLLGAVAVVLCLPFVILAIGIPIALCVRLLLWVGGLLL